MLSVKIKREMRRILSEWFQEKVGSGSYSICQQLLDDFGEHDGDGEVETYIEELLSDTLDFISNHK